MNRHDDPEVNDEALFDAWWHHNEERIDIQYNYLASIRDIAKTSFLAGIACVEEGWID